MDRKEMKSVTLTSNAQSDDTTYNFSIGLYLFKEDDYYIAYSPAFDLSSYAETFNEAIAAFYEAFQMHIEYCVENNTLAKDLKSHGWDIRAKEVKEPKLSRLLQNETVSRIFNGGFNYQYINSPVSIPVCAL